MCTSTLRKRSSTFSHISCCFLLVFSSIFHSSNFPVNRRALGIDAFHSLTLYVLISPTYFHCISSISLYFSLLRSVMCFLLLETLFSFQYPCLFIRHFMSTSHFFQYSKFVYKFYSYASQSLSSAV